MGADASDGGLGSKNCLKFLLWAETSSECEKMTLMKISVVGGLVLNKLWKL